MPAPLPKLEDVILRIQSEVYPRRMRVVDFFRDYDNLRRFEITQAQFVRALNLIMCNSKKLLPGEVEVLVESYKQANGLIRYIDLCKEIEKVFTTVHLETQPTAVVPKAGQQLKGLLKALPDVDDEMSAILYRVALLLRTRGLVMKYIFEDMDRGDSASLIVPRRAGKVTESQFRRVFPFGPKDFSEYETTRIVERYKDEDGNINYKLLHEEVTDPADEIKEPPVPKSDFVDSSVKRDWSAAQYSILDRVTAKILELRIRLQDYFLDFDPLRSGWIKAAQLDSVFNILGLSHSFSRQDIADLKAMYHRRDLNFDLFGYGDFCLHVNKAFVYTDIHTDPLARTTLPTSDATMPSRRSRVQLSEEEQTKVARIEEDVRAMVRKRRILFKNAFADFDRGGEGHVTVEQFKRVMSTLKCEVGGPGGEWADLLCRRYCDKGDSTSGKDMFNYRDFCRVCDPNDASLDRAEAENLAPYQQHQPDKYFDLKGRVYERQQ